MEEKNNVIRKLISYLSALGMNVKISNYDDRIKVQKVAFLVGTLINEPLVEDFSFYIKGPYSHNLTTCYFEHYKDFNNKSNYELDEKEKIAIDKISKVLGNSLDARTLEIVASLLFLVKNSSLNYEDAELRLQKLKPHLPLEAIWQGSNLLKILLLTENDRKTQMDAINKEMGPLDSVSNEALDKFAE